jgi:hypothetical protein
MAMFWSCQSSRTKCVFHYLQEVSAELKIIRIVCLTPNYLTSSKYLGNRAFCFLT